MSKPNVMSLLKLVTASLLLTTIFSPVTWAQTPAGGNSPSFKLDGEGTLLTNFVRRGLTQTENDPAFQGSFLFNFGPQFAMGLWGSNVLYPEGSTHLWLRIMAEIKIPFSENVKSALKYSQNQFYATNTRNGNTLGLHLDIYKYLVSYEMESNWEGRGSGSTHLAVGKIYPVFTIYNWENYIGYNMIKSEGYSNYFHFHSMIGRPFSSLAVSAGASITSAPSQFNGRGELMFILKASVLF
ncbi:MAG: TorF family putative porin [Bdellovibrionota bacterium]